MSSLVFLNENDLIKFCFLCRFLALHFFIIQFGGKCPKTSEQTSKIKTNSLTDAILLSVHTESEEPHTPVLNTTNCNPLNPTSNANKILWSESLLTHSESENKVLAARSTVNNEKSSLSGNRQFATSVSTKKPAQRRSSVRGIFRYLSSF